MNQVSNDPVYFCPDNQIFQPKHECQQANDLKAGSRVHKSFSIDNELVVRQESEHFRERQPSTGWTRDDGFVVQANVYIPSFAYAGLVNTIERPFHLLGVYTWIFFAVNNAGIREIGGIVGDGGSFYVGYGILDRIDPDFEDTCQALFPNVRYRPARKCRCVVHQETQRGSRDLVERF